MSISPMEERNIIGGMTAAALSGCIEFITPLKWFFLLGLVIILADLRFGVNAARIRGEKIRLSRAIRRTANKIVDYLCWIFLAGTLGLAFNTTLNTTMLPGIVLLVVYGIELNSCFSNYFESKGKKLKVNVFEYFSKKTDIIDINKEEEK